MNTDPLLQRTYDNGFGDAIEAISWNLEELTAAWGSVAVACDSLGCQVSDGSEERVYEAPTLLEALRLAAQAVEEEVKP